MTLRYLFVATLLNGKTIHQTRADVSSTDKKRSACWDLAEKNSGLPILNNDGTLVMRQDIRSFMLVGPKQRFAVDLMDGHFEIDGNRVGTIDGKPLIPAPAHVPLSLVYFRRNRKHINMAGNVIGSECEFHFGWKAPTGHSQTLVLE